LPIGLVIIQWDAYQGAEEFFRFPQDFHVSNEHIQQIQISHNFISSVMLHRDDDANVVSFYNDAHKKVIALFLSKYEEGQYYYKIIDRFDQVLVQNLPENEIKRELIEVYEYSFSVINAREEVMEHLAQKVSSLTEIEHDFTKRLEKLLELIEGKNLDSKILIALILHTELPTGELYKLINTDLSKSSFYQCLRKLEEQKSIKHPQRGLVRINF